MTAIGNSASPFEINVQKANEALKDLDLEGWREFMDEAANIIARRLLPWLCNDLIAIKS
jgi:hypothetical protein